MDASLLAAFQSCRTISHHPGTPCRRTSYLDVGFVKCFLITGPSYCGHADSNRTYVCCLSSKNLSLSYARIGLERLFKSFPVTLLTCCLSIVVALSGQSLPAWQRCLSKEFAKPCLVWPQVQLLHFAAVSFTVFTVFCSLFLRFL